MPKPEVACMLINAKSGYRRNNNSWILSRMLRDFDYWKPVICDEVQDFKLKELRRENASQWERHAQAQKMGLQSTAPSDPEDVRIGLRVTVWRCVAATGRGSGDLVYWIGLFVSTIQLCIAAVPWGIDGEWFSFVVVAGGTLLAYTSSALPQWVDEKVGVRKLKYTESEKERKDIILTEGNGTHEALLILGCEGGLDLEALASAQRDCPHAWSTRVSSIILAALWITLLMTVAGWDQHTWYIVGAGMIGILHNVAVAGIKRRPKAWGIDLAYQETIVSGKVMEVLRLTEESYPRAGAAMLEEFFPGKMFPRERLLWEYAERRAKAWKKQASGHATAKSSAWPMPLLKRPEGRVDDGDIVSNGPCVAVPCGVANVKEKSRDHVVDIRT